MDFFSIDPGISDSSSMRPEELEQLEIALDSTADVAAGNDAATDDVVSTDEAFTPENWSDYYENRADWNAFMNDYNSAAYYDGMADAERGGATDDYPDNYEDAAFHQDWADYYEEQSAWNDWAGDRDSANSYYDSAVTESAASDYS